MKLNIKILLFWLLSILLVRLSLFFPHQPLDDAALINIYAQLLLFIISMAIAIYSSGAQRFIFINFSIFFGYAIPLLVTGFIGDSLSIGGYREGVYSYFYISQFGDGFVLLFVVCYAIIDYFMQKTGVLRKYLLSLLFTSLVCGLIFLKFLFNPLQLSKESDYLEFTKVSRAFNEVKVQVHGEPTLQEIAARISPPESSVGTAQPEQVKSSSLEMVRKYRSSLEEGGIAFVYWRPVYHCSINVDIITVILLAVFLIAHLVRGRPWSAYNDKILILFFIFTTLEVIHQIGDLYSISTASYSGLFIVGHYVTTLIFLGFIYSFDHKLLFTLSVTGRYYEEVIVRDPMTITRWIDKIDTVILKTFFKNTDSPRRIGHITKLQRKN